MAALQQRKKSRKPKRDVDDFRADLAARAARELKKMAAVMNKKKGAPTANGGAAENEFLSPDGRVNFDKLPPADAEETPAIDDEVKPCPGQVLDDVHQRAAKAWGRLESRESLFDWLDIGASVEADRNAAMREACTNQPKGKGYCAAFSRLLSQRPYAKLEQTTRVRLLEIMKHQDEIITWLAKQPLSRQLELNHPHSVLRAWRKSLKPDKPKAESPVAKLKQSVAALEEENHNLRLKQEVKNSGGDVWYPEEAAGDIAKMMFDKLSKELSKAKRKAVVNAMLEMLRKDD
jgi:hypothetical protein